MPYSPAYGDHFYSRADGRAECAHVFIGGNGLPERFRHPGRFVIGETGFGTGLNFIETWRQWKTSAPQDASLEFVSFEKFPLPAGAIGRALSAWPELAENAQALIAAWPQAIADDTTVDFDRVRLRVFIGEAFDGIERWGGQADAWYLDGFAPARNPDMWSLDLMQRVATHTAPGGSFATYSAAGWVRRNLAAAGFEVEKRPGHAGKRDMCAGRLAVNSSNRP